MTPYLKLALAVLALALVGCASGPKSSRGFRLPDGDVQRGQAAFLELKCNECHTVAGVDLPAPEQPAATMIDLGGKVYKVRTYGQLVTSIINPSHSLAKGYPKSLISADGQSRMPDFTKKMTVSQMIDMVAFLQSHYQLELPEPVMTY